MAAQRSRFFGSNNEYIQKYFYPKCLTNYSIIKNEFEQRITALSRNKNRNYYNEHNKIRNYIIEKNKELNSCYGPNLLRTKLIADHDITSFLEKCPSKSNCPVNRVSQVKKVVPKHATEDPCKKGSNSCNKELPGKKVEPGPNQGQRDAEVSNTKNSKVQDSVDPDRNHAEADGLKQEDATHAQPEIKPFSKPVVRESEASKPTDNQNSSPLGHVGPPKDPISNLTDSATTQLDGQLIDTLSQRSPEQEPVSIDKLQEMTSDQNPDQNSPLNANTSDGQDSSATPLETKDSKGDDSSTEIFNQIFSTIQQNKENVINTSIPMGIVLLLSLLFKYTPLWRILTKRNRKKQSHMNEKLQRVLQQPSIGSGERSVPFSYSAFEYSS
ncbi:PIR protein [Plasmodium vivax]|uniref:VIR protein n=1 Tax=Plasmodium vivax TaxID=5855 RepID=A0A565A508_PLAVI|nr:PIR protein [Plasmodium vivax]